MVELPQQLIPNSTQTEVTDLPPVDVATVPPLSTEVTAMPTLDANVTLLPVKTFERIYGPAQPIAVLPSPPVNIVYTVPAGKRLLIDHFHACNTTNNTRWFTITIGDLLPENALWWETSLTANDILDHSPIQVLYEGETIQALQQEAGAVTITISGELLTL